MFDYVLNTFVILLVVIDPVSLAPIYAALTRGATDEYRRRMAIKGAGLAAGMLLLFAFVGNRLLDALGVGLPAFRIAGGVLLFLLAIDMVFARQSGLRSTTLREQHEAEHKLDVSVFPVAFPLIAGPGALTTVLLLSGAARGDTLEMAIFLGLLLLVLGMVLLALLLAGPLMHVLGETGANVVSRVLGLILAALAIQFILDGLLTGVFAPAGVIGHGSVG
jgi:multiple antibiotic resistance protein